MESTQMLAMRSSKISRFVERTRRFVMLFLVLSVSAALFCNAQNSASSTCENSTVADAWGPEFASQAKVFLAGLQSVVKSEDKEQFASLVQYPVHIFGGKKGKEIRTRADLIRSYSSIMTPDFKHAILAQPSECLFANGQGVMVGGGRIWFQKQSDGAMRIITFNLISSKRGI
jgi:hypothetical protein